MTVPAPEIIKRYFRAIDQGDIDLLVACFTEYAAVADEGRTHRGRDEILAWREQTRNAYQYTAKMLSIELEGNDRYVVATRLEGNFPGSPVEMKYLFTVRGDLISKLDIEP